VHLSVCANVSQNCKGTASVDHARQRSVSQTLISVWSAFLRGRTRKVSLARRRQLVGNFLCLGRTI
jgi:hypothetical protein